MQTNVPFVFLALLRTLDALSVVCWSFDIPGKLRLLWTVGVFDKAYHVSNNSHVSMYNLGL
jgi:hypothetical protein